MNKRSISIILILAFAAIFLGSAMAAETPAEKDARMQWWRDARFGLVIHFGLYAIPAGEWRGKTDYGEWIRDSARIPVETYEEFVGKFNPSRFNADAWVRAAKDAGMKYIVITSKHHDGFGLFDSKQTEFDIMSTPFGRDLLKELSTACQRHNIWLCFYYSIMDWDNPDYLPRRSWEPKLRRSGRMMGDYDKYVDYMKAQLRELLTNYGRLGVLWFDGEWEDTWNEKRGWDLYNFVRSLQPSIIINNRVGASRSGEEGFSRNRTSAGDFATPEQEIPAAGNSGVDWESCMTMNDHWGYNKADQNWKSAEDLIRKLVDCASKGGNFLLNVGPTAEGVFPNASLERLAEIGRWMKVNGESIYGTEAGPYTDLSWGRSTQNKAGKAPRVYLHVFDWPANGRLIIPHSELEPGAAYLLAAGNTRLEFERRGKAIEIRVPDRAPDAVDSVVVLETGGAIAPCAPPKIQPDSRKFAEAIDVTITPTAGVEGTRYTLDGREPTAASPRVPGLIHLTETTVVSARSFRGGIPCGETIRETYVKIVESGVHPALKGLIPTNRVHFAYFEGEWNALPQFDKMSPVATGLTEQIDLDPQKRHERYALEFNGFIRAPKTGLFTFFLRSDDGSRLWIDGVLVVDNDGSHGDAERSGPIALEDGYHTLKVQYFNKIGGEVLKVFWTVPGRSKEVIPASSLFHR
ncbi:MAG: alpha-L-fucosidase [Candidatus Aminicenantales bacterium]